MKQHDSDWHGALLTLLRRRRGFYPWLCFFSTTSAHGMVLMKSTVTLPKTYHKSNNRFQILSLWLINVKNTLVIKGLQTRTLFADSRLDEALTSIFSKYGLWKFGWVCNGVTKVNKIVTERWFMDIYVYIYHSGWIDVYYVSCPRLVSDIWSNSHIVVIYPAARRHVLMPHPYKIIYTSYLIIRSCVYI